MTRTRAFIRRVWTWGLLGVGVCGVAVGALAGERVWRMVTTVRSVRVEDGYQRVRVRHRWTGKLIKATVYYPATDIVMSKLVILGPHEWRRTAYDGFGKIVYQSEWVRENEKRVSHPPWMWGEQDLPAREDHLPAEFDIVFDKGDTKRLKGGYAKGLQSGRWTWWYRDGRVRSKVFEEGAILSE